MNASNNFNCYRKNNSKMYAMIPYATIDKNNYFGETVKIYT